MARNGLLLGIAGTLVCACATANSTGENERLSYTVAEDIDWLELPDGRATAPVYGDMFSGEHISYIRFPAGMRTALHTHSKEYVGVILQGTARHFQPEFEPDFWLTPGSVYRVPAAVPHISECAHESACIFLIHQRGAFDRELVE